MAAPCRSASAFSPASARYPAATGPVSPAPTTAQSFRSVIPSTIARPTHRGPVQEAAGNSLRRFAPPALPAGLLLPGAAAADDEMAARHTFERCRRALPAKLTTV